MKPGLKVVEGKMSVSIGQIPLISRHDVEATDLYVSEVDGGGAGHGSRVSWYAVIYRPKSNELFKIPCWDGESGGYQPDIAGGAIPNCQLEVH